MTFEVRVKCLICRKLTEPVINWEEKTNVETLNLLHYKLCAALKLEFSPKGEWDFAEEPFPYCESCGQRLQRLGELMDQLKSVEEEISGSLATVSALVILSDKSNKNSSEPPVTPKLGQVQEYFKNLEAKHNCFRSLIIQRLDPRVIVKRCDNSYPDLLEEHYDYELVPQTTLLKIESVIEESPDAVADETVFLDIKYKVDTVSNVTGGDEPGIIGATENGTSLTGEPNTTLISNASNLTTTFPSATDLGKKETYSRRHGLYRVVYDEASDNYLCNGFKFKAVENGYECCTCGKVFTVARSPPKWGNVKMHIKTAHLGLVPSCSRHVSRVCEECGKVCITTQALYCHRRRSHGSVKFDCVHCGKKFPFKYILKRHMVDSHTNKLKNSSARREKSFYTKKKLEPDARVHTGGGRIDCLRCGLQFKNLISLNLHKARIHEKKQVTLKEICSSGFGFRNDLK